MSRWDVVVVVVFFYARHLQRCSMEAASTFDCKNDLYITTSGQFGKTPVRSHNVLLQDPSRRTGRVSPKESGCVICHV